MSVAYTELQLMDLQRSQDKQSETFKNYEKMLEKFKTTTKNLKSLQTQKMAEIDGFSSFLDKFYSKASPYRELADKLTHAFEREKAEAEQEVR